MTDSRPSGATPDQARLIHALLTLGAVVTLAVLGMVKQVLGGEPLLPDAPWFFRVIPFLVLLLTLASIAALRSSVPARRDASHSEWEQAYVGHMLFRSFMAEGTAIVGAVCWFLIGDPLILIGVTGPALLMLLVSRPRSD